ncbi:MAG: hypothetical protein ACON35_03845 [Candidatus Marinamargulisbacteria bacterium]
MDLNFNRTLNKLDNDNMLRKGGPLGKTKILPHQQLRSQLDALDDDSTPRDIMRVVAILNDHEDLKCAGELVVKKNFITKLLAGLLLNEQGHNYSPQSCFNVNFKLLTLAKQNLDSATFCDNFSNGLVKLIIRTQIASNPVEDLIINQYAQQLKTSFDTYTDKEKQHIQRILNLNIQTIKKYENQPLASLCQTLINIELT